MDDSNILSTDEVDALMKAAQDKDTDLSKLLSRASTADEIESLNYKAISNIVELTWAECEKIFSNFIRKKVIIRTKETKFGKVAECLEGKTEKHVYSIFRIMPNEYYCLVALPLPLLHQMISALYGGSINGKDAVIEAPGNIGIIIAEKINELIMEGFILACKDYGQVTSELFKTITLPNLISKLSMEDEVYSMEYTVTIGDTESGMTALLPVGFLQKFIPKNELDSPESKKRYQSWRKAIESQVVDSYVSVVATLPAINIKAKDLLALKNGDVIPISDPTVVDICLNEVKLFKASVAQANSILIAKIVDER